MDAALSAEHTAHARAIQNRDTIIADLRLQLHGHKKHRFGSKSESSAQLALELILEEMEIGASAHTVDHDLSAAELSQGFAQATIHVDFILLPATDDDKVEWTCLHDRADICPDRHAITGKDGPAIRACQDPFENGLARRPVGTPHRLYQ